MTDSLPDASSLLTVPDTQMAPFSQIDDALIGLYTEVDTGETPCSPHPPAQPPGDWY